MDETIHHCLGQRQSPVCLQAETFPSLNPGSTGVTIHVEYVRRSEGRQEGG